MKLSQLHKDSPPDYLLEYAGIDMQTIGIKGALQTTGTGSEAARSDKEITSNRLGGMWIGTPKASAGAARTFGGGVSGNIPGGEEEAEEGAKEKAERKGDIRTSQGSEAPEDKPPMSWMEPGGPGKRAKHGESLEPHGGPKKGSGGPWTPKV